MHSASRSLQTLRLTHLLQCYSQHHQNQAKQMTHYLIAQINILDRETYTKYEAGFMQVFAKYDGSLLAVDEESKRLEGSWPYTRTVLISFPTAAQALAWYQSDDYQALAQHRFASSTANVCLIKGLEQIRAE